LRERQQSRGLIYAKLALDVATVASSLAQHTSGASALEFEERWSATRDEVEGLLAQGRTAEIAPTVSRLITGLAGETGDATGPELEAMAGRVHAAMEEAVLSGADHSGILDQLEKEAAEPLRSILRRRARSHAAVTDLVLSVGRLQ
jgi:hypothetical protein